MTIADVSNKSLTDLLSLKDRRAIITGGAQGLGKAIGRRLAQAGAQVLLADLNKEGAENAALELSEALGANILSAPVDVASSESITALAEIGTAKLGGIDIWVNNAGIFPVSPLLETSDDTWDQVLDVNLRGTFLGCREAARRMIKAGRGGVIINLTSVAGFRGITSGLSHYVASKHGVRGLTSQLAIELAPHDIRVLAVAPTSIMTEGWLQSKSAKNPTSLLGRSGVPDDVARVVLFCASDLSVFMTGSTIPIDAGRLGLA